MKTSLSAAVVLLLTVLGGPAVAEEMVDDPGYKSWASFKPETSVKFVTLSPDGKQRVVTTTTLKSVTAENVVLVTQTEIVENGRITPQPVGRIELGAKRAKSTLPPGGVALHAGAKILSQKEGKGTLEVDGKKIDTVTRELQIEQKDPAGGDPLKYQVKTWSSEKIPGGLVKEVRTVQSDPPATTTVRLVEYTIGK